MALQYTRGLLEALQTSHLLCPPCPWNRPGVHPRHADWPLSPWNSPGAHEEQEDFPVTAVYVPRAQMVHCPPEVPAVAM